MAALHLGHDRTRMTEPRGSYAFVLPWSIDHAGGVNEVVRNLIEEFRLAGEFRPVLIENHWASVTPVIQHRPEYTHVRMRFRQPDHSSVRAQIGFLLALPRTLWRLTRLVASLQIVAFNIHYPGLTALNWTALRALRLFPGKLILSFHGSDIRGAYALTGWSRQAYRYMLRKADAIVPCSEGLQSEVSGLEPRARTRVIYNGIDEGRFRMAPGPRILPPELLQKELVLNIGKYEYRKAHDLLLRAFARVLEKRPSAHLVIVGATGPEIEKTRAEVAGLGVAHGVTLYHDLPHSTIPAILAAARLFVLSSRWVPGKMGEGFPVAILEAGLAGKPVVTTRTCGASEIIEDGVTGRLVPLEDAAALADAICETLENELHAREMAESLRRRILESFTWRQAYRAYVSLCRVA